MKTYDTPLPSAMLFHSTSYPFHMLRPNPLCPSPLSAVRLEGGHPNLMPHDISVAIMHDLGFFFRGFLTSLIGFAFRGTRSPWIPMRVTATSMKCLFQEDLGGETGGGVSLLRYCTPVERPRSPTWGNLCSTGHGECGVGLGGDSEGVVACHSVDPEEHHHTPMRIGTSRAPILSAVRD